MQLSIVPANNFHVFGVRGQSNESGDSIVHVRLRESEAIKIDEGEVVLRAGGPDEDVRGIVVEMQDAAVVLRNSESGKLMQQRARVRASGGTVIQQGTQVEVMRPVAADIVATPQATEILVLDAGDRVGRRDFKLDELLCIEHGT